MEELNIRILKKIRFQNNPLDFSYKKNNKMLMIDSHLYLTLEVETNHKFFEHLLQNV